MLTLRFQLDAGIGRKNSKFDTAAATISKRANKSIERRGMVACHIILQSKNRINAMTQHIARRKSLTCFARHPAMEFALGLMNDFGPTSSKDCAIIVLIFRRQPPYRISQVAIP